MKVKDETKKKIDIISSIIIIVIIAIALLVIVKIKIGPLSGELHCSYKNNTNTMISSLDYKLKFKNKNVTKLETEEIISSDDEELIETYKASIEELSTKYEELEHYKTNITTEDNKLIIKTIIDYSKIDMKKYLQIEGEKTYIKNNKLKIDEIKKIYERNGATCKFK